MFTSEQYAAIHAESGPVMVLSCPGSGKTTVVIERVIELLKRGYDAERIAIMTFTRNAANEMKTRFQKKIKDTDSVKMPEFGTIHHLCMHIINIEKQKYCLDRNYPFRKIEILPENDIYSFFRKNIQFEENNYIEQENQLKQVIMEISKVRNNLIPLKTFKPSSINQQEFYRIYKLYNEYKRNIEKYDFDDILLKVYYMFCNQKEVLYYWQNHFDYIIVDEFQDVNPLQANIIYKLAQLHKNIFIVGDDDQSIYKFRGAEPKLMLNFPDVFSGCQVVRMTKNFRSKRNLVQNFSNLIEKNRERFSKNIVAHHEDEGLLKTLSFKDNHSTYSFIVSRIRECLKEGYSYSDIAVLYRNNFSGNGISMELLQNHIPFDCDESVRKITQYEVFLDILSCYHLLSGIAQIKEKKDIFRKFCPYISNFLMDKTEGYSVEELKDKFMEYLNRKRNEPDMEQWKIDNQIDSVINFFEMLSKLTDLKNPDTFFKCMKDHGYQDYIIRKKSGKSAADGSDISDLEMQCDVILYTMKDCNTMEEWITRVNDYSLDMEDYIRKQSVSQKDRTVSNSVRLSTIHGSKGLEWKIVFLIDVNDGIIPSRRIDNDLEEERRVFYVAISRAKEQLYICCNKDKKISPFIDEMRIPSSDSGRFLKPDSKQQFTVGDLVYSKVDGKGTVTSIIDDRIEITYFNGKIKKFSLSLIGKLLPFEHLSE